jgi:hypothetical protein
MIATTSFMVRPWVFRDGAGMAGQVKSDIFLGKWHKKIAVIR